MTPIPRSDDLYVDRLLTASATVVGRFTTASNATLLLALHDADGTVPEVDLSQGLGGLEAARFAVYKPELGEAPLWDFPDHTLWRREIAACVVDRALGLDMVPTTVGRDDLEHGVGAVQRLVPHDPEEHYFAIRDDEDVRDQLRRMVVFDLLLDNADRKAGHVLVEHIGGTRRLRLIDHGVCFHPLPHLRTVAWDFAGQPMRDDERALAANLVTMLEEGHPSVQALHGLLRPDEVQRLADRALQVAQLEEFPRPEHDRQHPWPLL